MGNVIIVGCVGDYDCDDFVLTGEPMKPGDKVTWFTQHSSYEALKEDFGDGPFTILGVEDGAPEHGQWVSITRDSDGLAWVDHNNQWESPKCEDPKLHKAIPPTFHSQWFVHLDPPSA